RVRGGIQDDIHGAHAGNSVRQAVMNSSHHSGAPTLQTRHSEIPQRPLPVQALAHDLAGQRLECVLRAVLEFHFSNVVPNVELRVELPSGKAEIERRRHRALTVAGNQRELRFDESAEVRELYLALEHTDARDIERLAWAFDMQKQRIAPGEGIVPVPVRHSSYLFQGSSFPRLKQGASTKSLRPERRIVTSASPA